MLWKPLSRDVREAVIDRDGLTCRMCGVAVVLGGDPTARDALNIDHIIQRAIGGSDALENLRVVCADCNRRRPKPLTGAVQRARSRYRPIADARRQRRREQSRSA